MEKSMGQCWLWFSIIMVLLGDRDPGRSIIGLAYGQDICEIHGPLLTAHIGLRVVVAFHQVLLLLQLIGACEVVQQQ